VAIDDNPIKAVKRQFEIEALGTSPVTERIAELASSVPLPPILGQIIGGLKKYLADDTAAKDRLLMETIAEEVVKHAEALEGMKATITEQQPRLSTEEMIPLFVDAMRKAESTRAEERVRRIGLIFANAVFEKQTDSDEIEELMRVATELGERDVEFLAELVRIEGGIVRNQGRIERYSAHTIWEQGSWGNRVDPELDSVFSKLESYGLVTRLAPPNNLNIMADMQNRYALLPKGARFVDLIKSRSAAK
jgi:hypothetical protein